MVKSSKFDTNQLDLKEKQLDLRKPIDQWSLLEKHMELTEGMDDYIGAIPKFTDINKTFLIKKNAGKRHYIPLEIAPDQLNTAAGRKLIMQKQMEWTCC